MEFNGKTEAEALTSAFAASLDKADALSDFRDEFIFPPAPKESGRDRAIYLCGNSLGLQPKGLAAQVTTQLTKWGEEGVEGHFTEPTPWLTIDDIVQNSLSKLVGALPTEVVAMNSLTVNLHMLMCSFYCPDVKPNTTSSSGSKSSPAGRHIIITEKKAFPSDTHAVTSQIQHWGLDPSTSLVEIAPREGEVTLRTDDILAVIEKAGTELCLVMLSGVQYYTGQLFDMEAITQAGHAQGAIVGFDLAHAAGNVPLRLHDWGVDFAVWCSYKYLNCGPGSIAGAFVHERHGTAGDAGAADEADRTPRVRLAGWWGHRQSDRFDMAPEFVPCQGAYGYRCSNPPVLLVACLRASLDLYDRATMPALREKSLKLTGYLEYLLQMMIGPEHVSIFTPSNQAQRGAQLSLKFSADLGTVFDEMSAKGFVCDVRKPHVMRVAPAPLYNSFSDVHAFVTALREVLLK